MLYGCFSKRSDLSLRGAYFIELRVVLLECLDVNVVKLERKEVVYFGDRVLDNHRISITI